MSTTKTEIQSNISTKMASGQSMPIETHRGVLKDDDDVNLLDNFYPDVQSDTSSSETFWDLATPGSCTYAIQYSKQGRIVTLSGQITNVTSVINTLADINLPHYYAVDSNVNQYGFGWRLGGVSGSPHMVLFTVEGGTGSTTVKVANQIEVGETVSFSIQYMTEN